MVLNPAPEAVHSAVRVMWKLHTWDVVDLCFGAGSGGKRNLTCERFWLPEGTWPSCVSNWEWLKPDVKAPVALWGSLTEETKVSLIYTLVEMLELAVLGEELPDPRLSVRDSRTGVDR